MVEVFLGREALGEGLRRHDLRSWYRPIFRGVYIPKASTPSLHDRTVGAWLTTNRAGVIAGVAASALHDLRGPIGHGLQSLLIGQRKPGG